MLLNALGIKITTITDITGRPIASLYDQQRIQVGYNDISPNMVRSIVSIEDHRFFEHDGVDWHGTIRAFLRNSSSGSVQQGASTISSGVAPARGAGAPTTPAPPACSSRMVRRGVPKVRATSATARPQTHRAGSRCGGDRPTSRR